MYLYIYIYMYLYMSTGLAPHGSMSIPNTHIVISHEPPYGVLDQVM
jgi:hypothetical protein